MSLVRRDRTWLHRHEEVEDKRRNQATPWTETMMPPCTPRAYGVVAASAPVPPRRPTRRTSRAPPPHHRTPLRRGCNSPPRPSPPPFALASHPCPPVALASRSRSHPRSRIRKAERSAIGRRGGSDLPFLLGARESRDRQGGAEAGVEEPRSIQTRWRERRHLEIFRDSAGTEGGY